MSGELAISIAAFLGLAGLALWLVGAKEHDDGYRGRAGRAGRADRRGRAGARSDAALIAAAVMLAAVLVTVALGPAGRARVVDIVAATLARAEDPQAAAALAGLWILANGAGLMLAAFAMALARLGRRAPSTFAQAEPPRPKDARILLAALALANLTAAALSVAPVISEGLV